MEYNAQYQTRARTNHDYPTTMADAPTICVPTPAGTLAPALVLEPVATVGATSPPTWVEPTENSTRKRTCFWTTAPVPSSTTSLALHRNTAAVPPPWVHAIRILECDRYPELLENANRFCTRGNEVVRRAKYVRMCSPVEKVRKPPFEFANGRR